MKEKFTNRLETSVLFYDKNATDPHPAILNYHRKFKKPLHDESNQHVAETSIINPS